MADPVEAVSLLSEPTRRALYEHVARSAAPVSRDDAAAATGTARGLAAFHMDKLVEGGLLAAEFRRTGGRSGPGAGRPSKLYRRVDQDVAVSLPPRHYDLAGSLLAGAVQTSKGARAALEKSARARGHAIGSALRAPKKKKDAALAGLEAAGYEPERERDGTIRLRNCPFHALVGEHKDLVCGMNLSLLSGMLEGLDDSSYSAVLAPEPGFCCVAFRPERG